MALPGVGGRERKQKELRYCSAVMHPGNPYGIPIGSATEARQFTLPFIATVSSLTLDHKPVFLSDPVLSKRMYEVPTGR